MSAHSHDKPFRPTLAALLGLAMIEVPIVDLITHPWPAIRFPLLALGIWGVVTMIGMLLSAITRPHGVGPDGVLIRSGGDVDIALSWELIRAVGPRRRPLPGAPSLCLTGAEEVQALHQIAQDGTDIDIELEGPTSLTISGHEVQVSSVHISVDDPGAFLDAVRRHIP